MNAAEPHPCSLWSLTRLLPLCRAMLFLLWGITPEILDHPGPHGCPGYFQNITVINPQKKQKDGTVISYWKYHTLIIYLSHHIRSKSVGKNQLLYIPLWLFTTGISPKGPPPWPRRGVSWSKGHRVLATFGAGGWVVKMGQWRRKWSDEPTDMGILHSMDWLI